MNYSQKILDLAEVGHAAYGQYPLTGRIADLDRLIRLNEDDHGFATAQAERFRSRFNVAVPTYNDISPTGASNSNFDATVFRGIASDNLNQITLAIRGTQQLPDVAESVSIGPNGAAFRQIVAMYNWWQRVGTLAGTAVAQFRVSPRSLGSTTSSVFFEIIRVADVTSTGEVAQLLMEDPDGKLDVVGTSLGGHLAMAFAGLFGSQIRQAAAFNSPGFAVNSDVTHLFSALGGRVPTAGSPNVLNFISDEANTPGASLEPIAGYHSIPGQRVNVPIENQFFTDVPDPKFLSYNHDQRQVDDALTLYAFFSRMQADFSLDSLRTFMRNAAAGPATSLENLVNAIESFLGLAKSVLPASNAGRDALHSAVGRLGAALDGPLSVSLGNLLVRASSADLRAAARNDFSALVALQDISPIWISGKTAAADATLATLWQNTRAADYAAWQVDKTTANPETFTDQWIADRAAMLGALVERNKTDAGIVSSTRNILYYDKASNTQVLLGAGDAQRTQYLFGGEGADPLDGKGYADHLYGGTGNDTLDGKGGSDYLEGNAGDDNLQGGEGQDTLLGGSGDDELDGGAGVDILKGGQGTDTYTFTSSFGNDTILDSDGLGSVKVDSYEVTAAKAAGQRNVWMARLGPNELVNMRVYDDVSSSTGKKLVITRAGETANTISITNFDLAKAQSSEGYLGIKLEASTRIIIKQGTDANPFTDVNFNPTAINGFSQIKEGGSSFYTVYLSAAAAAGETITLALTTLGNKFKAIVGDSKVDANGAVITMAEGQTQVSFSLVQEGEVTADGSSQLSVTYQGGSQSAVSNNWGINLTDSGEATNTYIGDQRALLIGSSPYYDWLNTAWAADGTLTGGVIEENFNDVIGGAAGNDKISGLGGNDALLGRAGNDEIDGGDGDDLVFGGTGSDNIKGGGGKDVIFGASSLTLNQRIRTDDAWELPEGQTVWTHGSTWGISLDAQYGLILPGNSDAVLDPASDVVDAGSGDDRVYAGHGSDNIQGGAGNDEVWGNGGDDVIDGGGDEDVIYGDGFDGLTGYEKTPWASHGKDFLDGGAGKDYLFGLGQNDALFGGLGDDFLVGDYYYNSMLPGEYHGNDYLDGEEGDDVLLGGGRADTLYGGVGNDRLVGDDQTDTSLAPSHGDDYLDGEDGDDELFGGGMNDTLFGGAGGDSVYGDDAETVVAGQLHGADYLDGEDGNDYLFGGGKDDTLFGGADNDQLHGDDASDRLSGEFHGNDYLDGESGNDVLFGGGGQDTLLGGVGEDQLQGDDNQLGGQYHGDDYLDGGADADRLYGQGGDDTLHGGEGNDLLLGDERETTLAGQYHGNDLLDGGSGDDALEGGGGDDTLIGGAGNDLLHGDAPNELLAEQWHGDDYLSGGDGNDTLYGGAGNDKLSGGAGNDTLIAGSGADHMDGGEGDDRYEAGAGDTVTDTSGSNTLTLADGEPYSVTASGSDLLLSYGDGGSLTITGAFSGGIAVIDGVALGDWLQGRLNQSLSLSTSEDHQTLTGGAGGDQLTALHGGGRLLGGGGSDTLQGSAGNDTLDGGSGNDSLSGGAGNDILHGGSGDDVIDGSAGDDWLHAGSGVDTLRGGVGQDTYVLGYGMGQVTVIDDSPEGSTIQMDASGLQLQSLTARRANNDLLVEVRGTETSMRIRDYYGATQASWVFKDIEGNALSAQALIDASIPNWSDLRANLIQDFKAWARGDIGEKYAEQGFVRQADGHWILPVDPNYFSRSAFSNQSRELTQQYLYTHQSLADPDDVRTTSSSLVLGTTWIRSTWLASNQVISDALVSFEDETQTVSDASIVLTAGTYSSSNQVGWTAISSWVQDYSATEESAWSQSHAYSWPTAAPTELITEQRRLVEAYKGYSGKGGALIFDAPTAAALAGPLPGYIPVTVTHNYFDYNLGETMLSDGDHTVMANQHSAVIGGLGDNIIYGAGFAYGGTGNATLVGGDILMAGNGNQYLENGRTMVVGDGHTTVVGKARGYLDEIPYLGNYVKGRYVQPDTRILIDPNNTGMDLLVCDDDSQTDKNLDWIDDSVEAIYRSQGVLNARESYAHGGKFFVGAQESYGGYYNTEEEGRQAFIERTGSNAYVSYYVQPLSVLLRTPTYELDRWEEPSSYYITHPLSTISLVANDFAAMQPYLDTGLLPTKTVSFGQGLSLSEITLSWSSALSPLDGNEHVTLDLRWGVDQGVQVMIPRSGDPLNGTVGQFEFADGQVVSMSALVAMAPPAPSFDIGFTRIYAGMGQQTLAAELALGFDAGSVELANIEVQSDGVDLVISMNNGEDSLRLEGWYSDEDDVPNALLTTNGSFRSAQELTLRGSTRDGSAGNMILYGIPGFATTLIAGPNTTLIGQSGNDTYVFNAGSGAVHISDPGGGTLRFGAGITPDMVSLNLGSLLLTIGDQGDAIHLDGFDPSEANDFSSVQNFEFADGTELEFAELLERGFDIRGTASADTLMGTNLSDRLYGGEGADRMTGGDGDDTYYVDNVSDVIVERAGEGSDTVIATVSKSLSAHVENLTMAGEEAINGAGNSLDNIITGNAAKNTLNGGAGADSMAGRGGDDSYYVDNADDEVVEAPGEGTDRVIASISYALGDNIEDLQLSGSADIDATGNELANKLTGNSGANTLYGWAGDDRLTGGLSADQMQGGEGHDLYEVDNTADVVTELEGEGVDTVEASVTYTLGANVENLILTGLAAIDGTGNELNNLLQGNAAANTLTGGAGNDSLNGMKGLDILVGGAGNDTYLFEDDMDDIAENVDGGRDTLLSRISGATLAANVEDGVLLGSAISLTGNELSNVLTGNNAANTLDGGAGADVMMGGKGNDLYIVDGQADTLNEIAGEGTDTVQSSVSYSLGDNVEHLTLTGTAEAGMGNELNNKLTGNAASNKLWGGVGHDELDGGAGADILIGGLGNDKYWVDSRDDLLVENAGEGTDTVYASVSYALPDNVERLILTGSTNINAVGNALNNRLEGNAGNNILFGGLGNDTYVFGRGSGHDIIANFDAGKPSGDMVQLGAGIVDADISLLRVGSDLVLSINGSGDQLTVASYFENGGKGANALEKIRFADGSSLNHAAVLSRTAVDSGGASEAQALPAEVRTGNPTALFDAAAPTATKTSDATVEPQTVAESIAAARERFEQGLQNLKYSVDEQGSLSRSEFAERRALPLLWNLQDALLDMQLAKSADGRFTGDISIDSRGSRDLGLAIGLLGGVSGTVGRLDQVARPQEVQQFDLAQMQ